MTEEDGYTYDRANKNVGKILSRSNSDLNINSKKKSQQF